MRYLCLLLCLFAAAPVLGQGRGVRVAAAHRHPTAQFVENNGQWQGAFSVQTRIPGTLATAFFAGGVWAFVQKMPLNHADPTAVEKARLSNLPKAFAWRMRFLNHAPWAKATVAGMAEAPIHYHSARGRHTVIPKAEGRVTGLYPGIDALLFYDQGRLRFDLHLAPKADPAQISWQIEGTTAALEGGALALANPYGKVYLSAPKAFQIRGKDTTWVRAKYKLSAGAITFALGRYDMGLPLVIDPQLVFSTYSGALSDNWGSTATFGPDGTVFAGGAAFGAGFPVTVGALDTSYNDNVDIAIQKFSADGSRLLWSTYLGGSSTENAVSLVAGAQGQLYVMGVTSSADYPTTAGAAQRTFSGGPMVDPLGYQFYNYYFPNGSDLILSCISPDGSTLTASTYLGGTGTDGLLLDAANSPLHRNYGDCFRGEVILDAAGRPCIATSSLSANFTVARRRAGRLGVDGQALLLRLSPRLDTLLNSIAYGGSQLESAYGLDQDAQGRTFVCGGTTSADLPQTAGGLQPRPGGNTDGYVARARADWAGIDSATYLSTAGYDQAYLVQVDGNGRPVVVGQTSGAWPRTAGTWTQGNAGGQFIQGLTAGLSRATFSTAYGGPAPNLVLTAFLIDICNQLYIAGWGGNTNSRFPLLGGTTQGLPITPDAAQATTDGSDFHVMVLDPEARALSYGTFFGSADPSHGEHVDGGTSRFDRRSIAYQAVCGCGGSAGSLPTTPGAYSPRNGSFNCNTAAVKYDFALLKAGMEAQSGLSGCAPFRIRLRNKSLSADSLVYTLDTIGTLSSRDTVVQYTFQRPGRYRIVQYAYQTLGCLRQDTTSIVVTVYGFEPTFRLPDTTLSICRLGDPIGLQTPLPRPGLRVTWAPALYLTDSTLPNPTATPTGNVAYRVTVNDGQGCSRARTVRLLDRRLRLSTTLKDTTVCSRFAGGFKANLLPGGTGAWLLNGQPIATGADTATVLLATPGRYRLRFEATNDTTCQRIAADSALITVVAPPTGRDTTFSLCQAQDTVAVRLAVAPGLAVRWVPGRYLTDSTSAVTTVMPPGNQAYTINLQDSLGCKGNYRVRFIDRRLLLTTNLADTAGCQEVILNGWAQATAGTRLAWELNGQAIGSGSVLPGLPVNRPGANRLVVWAQNDTTCQARLADTATVTINLPRPGALYADTSLATCQAIFSLRAPEQGPGFSYRWQGVGYPPGSFTYDSTQPTVRVVHNQALQGQILLEVRQGGCLNRRTYQILGDTVTPGFSLKLQYDTCQNLYRPIVWTTNPLNDSWQFSGPGVSPLRLAYGDSAGLGTFPGGGPALRLVYQVRKGICGLLREALYPLPDTDARPVSSFSYTVRYPDCAGTPLVSLAAGQLAKGRLAYKLDDATLPSTTFRMPDSLQHRLVQVAQIGGCKDSSQVVVALPVLQVGNVLTPNADGFNDALTLPATDGEPWALEVYSRWGQNVGRWSPYVNGSFPPQALPPGTYLYRLSGGGLGQACRGWIEVLRAP